MQHTSYRFEVSGRVQGVYFRQSCKQLADRLGLAGWIRNRPDGRVEGVVSGQDADAISQFHDWLKIGPSAARVSKLRWGPFKPGDDAVGFEVRR
ncbi:MAG: acylphosphatase [Panacagrimonas sp.]